LVSHRLIKAVAGREIEDAVACLALEDSSELTPPSPYDLPLGLCS